MSFSSQSGATILRVETFSITSLTAVYCNVECQSFYCAVLITIMLGVALLIVIMLSAVAPPFIIFLRDPFLCRQAEGDREGSLLVQTEKNGAWCVHMKIF